MTCQRPCNAIRSCPRRISDGRGVTSGWAMWDRALADLEQAAAWAHSDFHLQLGVLVTLCELPDATSRPPGSLQAAAEKDGATGLGAPDPRARLGRILRRQSSAMSHAEPAPPGEPGLSDGRRPRPSGEEGKQSLPGRANGRGKATLTQPGQPGSEHREQVGIEGARGQSDAQGQAAGCREEVGAGEVFTLMAGPCPADLDVCDLGKPRRRVEHLGGVADHRQGRQQLGRIDLWLDRPGAWSP